MTGKLDLLRERHSAIQLLVQDLSKPHTPEETERVKKNLKIQEEELIQLMIKIDAIETAGSDKLRALRKSTVQDVQKTLSTIDEILKSK